MPRTISDTELITLLERIGQQDEVALQRLHGLVASRFSGLAMRVVRTRDMAEDVVQEAFLSIWRIAADYQPARSPPMAWMAMIVRSRAIEALRRLTAERAYLTDVFDESLSQTLPCDGPDPGDVAQSREQTLALHYCMTLLDMRQRKLITLAYLQDRSHREIAADLALPLGTVKTVIRRGLLRLCDTMSGNNQYSPLSLRHRADHLANRHAFTG